jgi:hypothetical protein
MTGKQQREALLLRKRMIAYCLMQVGSYEDYPFGDHGSQD